MLNKVILIGNFGQDPEKKSTQNGTSVANCSIATNKKWFDKQSGEQQSKTEWHRVTFWGKTADIVCQYCAKGSLVYIEGELTTKSWEDKDTGKKRYSTEVMGREIKFLNTKGKSSNTSSDEYNQDANEDIPF